MGNRAQIVCNGVFIYSHWDGFDGCFNAVHDAIVKAQDRWDDPSYLTRVIFSQLVKEHIEDTIGYGLSAEPVGDCCPTIIVDCEKKLVGWSMNNVSTLDECTNGKPFDAFVDEQLDYEEEIALENE